MTSGLPRLSECRSCHEPIRFVKLDTGNAMPVNPAQNPTGNVAACLIGGQLHGHVISRDKPVRTVERFRFIAHYATCTERKRPEPKPEKPEPVEIPDEALW